MNHPLNMPTPAELKATFPKAPESFLRLNSSAPATPTAAYQLPLLEPPARTNAKNDGRQFQGDLEMTCKAYERAGAALIRKVDPPVRVIWPFDAKLGKKVQRVIFMKNPYPDLIGAWTAQGGRALVVELKSTSSHRLPLNRHGGLTPEQVAALTLWRDAGAASCLLWRFGPDCRLFSAKMIQADLNLGQKSLVHSDGLAVPKGTGTVIWDFLPVLAGCES